MEKSEQINELATALSMAQGEFPMLEKKSKAYNYNYADLAETLQATQAILKNHKLSIIHQVKADGMLVTRLMHASGQWVSTEMPLIYRNDGKGNAMQALGSAITYAKRYAIGCLLNLAADKEIDDDGEKTHPRGNHVEPQKHSRIGSDQIEVLESFLKEFPDSRKDLLARFQVSKVEDIPLSAFESIVGVFNKKRQAKMKETNEQG